MDSGRWSNGWLKIALWDIGQSLFDQWNYVVGASEVGYELVGYSKIVVNMWLVVNDFYTTTTTTSDRKSFDWNIFWISKQYNSNNVTNSETTSFRDKCFFGKALKETNLNLLLF